MFVDRLPSSLALANSAPTLQIALGAVQPDMRSGCGPLEVIGLD